MYDRLDIVVVAAVGLTVLAIAAIVLCIAMARTIDARDRAEKNLRDDRAAERQHRTWNSHEGRDQ